MYPELSRKTTWTIAVVLSLTLLSFAVESKSPAAEPDAIDAVDTPAGNVASAQATNAIAATTIERDAGAIKALEDMSNYMKTLKAIQVEITTSRDEVLDDGQNITYSGTVNMLAERPNRLRIEMINDKQQRMYFGDGKNFSVWAPRANYYATIPSPPTLRALADTLADRYHLELPVADLFHWGDGNSTAAIVGAIDVGPSPILGTTCEHYAFRQEGADWQVWIQKGNHPLPRKLVITTLTDPARPRFTAVMTWNLAPSYDAAAFTFDSPKDARKIVLAEATSADSK
jgi:hypothetical protein